MSIVKMKMAAPDGIEIMPLTRTIELLSHSVILGAFLMIIAIWAARRLRPTPLPGADMSTSNTELILGSGNYLFMTIGMTVVMILVNNNLARAFAIGAAISLVRFRIKVDSKSQGTTLLMAVLIGMAIGVEQIPTAWGLMMIFGVLQIFIISAATVGRKKVEATSSPHLKTARIGT